MKEKCHTKPKDMKKEKKPYKMTHDSGGFHFFLWPTMAICRILRLYTLATKELDSSLSPIFFKIVETDTMNPEVRN